MSDVRRPRAGRVATLVAAALAEDLGLLGDITSIACIRRRPDGASAVFVAREEGVLAGTALVDEVFRQVDREVDGRLGRARRRPGRSRHRARRGRRARCVRSSPASASRSTSCATARASRRSTRRYVRAARGKARILDTRKTLPGPARGAARGGARRRRVQPPRLALGRGADQGQPPRRRCGIDRGGRAGPRALAGAHDRGRVRHARTGRRGARRRRRRRHARQHDARARSRRPSRSLEGAAKVEVSGGVTLDTVRRLRRDRRRLHLGRRDHALGARARHRSRHRL